MGEKGDVLEEADREADLLEQIPRLGHPESDKERLASWLRVAIRRFHRNLRHLAREALVQMLRAARAPQDCANAAKTYRCQGCDNTKPRSQTHKVSPPRPYAFNHEVGVDVFEIVDSVGMRFSILNAVCMGTTYHQAWIVRVSETLGSPSPHACLRAFVHGWTRWAGWPGLVRCDRRTHNRGVFSSTLAKNGVMIRLAGLEAPEQIGRVERRGEMPKKMMSKVIKDTHASGKESMDMILNECWNAANELTRHGGFAPGQWVLSRVPRSPATKGDEDECLEVSALQAHADGPTTFGVQSRYRAKAREAFVRWDCGERVRRAALRKAAPVVGSYQVGDTVSYCTEPRAGEHGLQWSVGSRLIGFEEDKNSLGETQPRTCRIICDSLPFSVAVDRLRPRTPAELLAFHCTQTKSSTPLAADAQTQEGFIGERISLCISTIADPSGTANDERDDEMSEPTQMTSAGKRKVDETAKELRASLPKPASSHASSLRLDDETQEQLTRSGKQARTTMTGVEHLKMSLFFFKKGIVSISRMDFFK